MMEKRYKDYASILKKIFDGRVQKISINAGFSCPNRDGKIGTGGCTYCNNQSFTPDYCKSNKSITQQIDEGVLFFDHKYKTQKYLAYFQSFTNTYGSLNDLISIYEEALNHEKISGIVIGTRPDCVSDELLDYFFEVSSRRFVMLEYGVESTCEDTLKFINRGHSFLVAAETIKSTAKKGIFVGAHLILGLPCESREQLIEHARNLSQLPIHCLKLHQLQIIKGTKMAKQYAENPEWFHLFTAEEYIDLVVDFLEWLNPEIAIERFVSQSPKELIVAPDWGLKNYEFAVKIEKRLAERNTWQGRLFLK